MPFEIPSSWVWTTLGELCSIKGGKRIPKGKTFSKEKTEHIYLRVTDMKDNSIIMSDLKYIDDDVYNEIKNYIINSSDLYLTIAGTIGSVGTVPDLLDGMNLTENAAKLTNILCDKMYLMYSLLSTIAQEHFSSRFHQVAQPKLSIETASKTLLPIPPIEEQQRIVAEIKKWFTQIDQIEQGKADIQTAIKQTKSKILDLAIHGKLVPQDPNDESASELLKRINPAAEITCDNGQYEKVPKGWCLCRLGDIGEIVTGNTPTKDIAEYYGGSIPFYKPTDLDKGKCVENASDNLSFLGFEQSRKIPANSILVTCIGATIGKTGLITVEGSCNQQINAIIPNDAAFAEFVYYTCISDYLQKEIKLNASATTLPILNKSNFAKLLFPLPPLAEQRRIVAKIEELFSLLDNIQKALEV